MFSPEENQLLTQVGPGTPMGALFRRYWLPALLSEELPGPDGAPVAVHLLGERFVAFRDTTGNVGLLEEQCAHRGASLLFARNEEHGLRCIYHGWKYDRMGRCLDTPNLPAESTFKDTVRLQAYPTHEVAGTVWAYLGPPEKLPPFPAFAWLKLPPAQCKVYKVLQECNYAQALERDVDPAHVPIAHRRLREEEVRAGIRLTDFDRRETAPHIEVQPTNCGFRVAAIRPAEVGTRRIRITFYVVPCHLVLGPIGGHRVAMSVVPRDDQSNWHFLVRYDPEQPIDLEYYTTSRGLHRLDTNYRKLQTRDNRYRQDREAMKTWSFNGIEGAIIEDHALSEIQGPLVDRGREQLVPTDLGVIALRRCLLDAAQAVMNGQEPPGLDPSLPFDRIAGQDITAPADVPWQEASPPDPALMPVRTAQAQP